MPVDGGAEGERLAGERDDGRARPRAGVRCLEERRLEIGVATRADEEPLLEADEGVGLPGTSLVAARRAGALPRPAEVLAGGRGGSQAVAWETCLCLTR